MALFAITVNAVAMAEPVIPYIGIKIKLAATMIATIAITK